MVDFAYLNWQTSQYKNVEEPKQPWYRSQGSSMSAADHLAEENNRTWRHNNGQPQDGWTFTATGVASTGRR